MALDNDIIYVAECSKCGAKISQSGDAIGGNLSCSHKYGALGGYDAKAKDTQVVILYPTDTELHWIRSINENKQENIDHYKQFTQDAEEISKLKKCAMNEVSSMCKTLRATIDKRQEELEQTIMDSFEVRQEAIHSNMKQLTEHKNINIEAKNNFEDLLKKNDKLVTEREKTIVAICENVMNTIPELRYIETELHCSFPSLKRIENYIAEFGVLHTKPIDCGEKCRFTNNQKQSKAKEIEIQLPFLQLKKSTFYTQKQKVKLTFKIIIKKDENKDIAIDIMKYLKIKVVCLDNDDDYDDEKKDIDNDSNKSIHEEIIALADCQSKGSNYELFLNHNFNSGITVIFKIQAIFDPPDNTKYKSLHGVWSKEKMLEIPENDNFKEVVFNVELEDEQRKLCVVEGDAVLTNFEEFKIKFLKVFGRELQVKEYLILFIVDGDILNAKHNLMKCSNATSTISGKIVTIPKKLGVVVDFKGQKKKLNLINKAKENIYQFRMEFVKNHLISRYQKHKLGKYFHLKRINGKHIQFIDTDHKEDILKYFIDYDGVIEIIEKQNQ